LTSPNLRVTERCLRNDLGLSKQRADELLTQDARLFEDEHAAVKKFVAMRKADPRGGEPIHGPYPRGRVRSLHVGETRAVTAWDEDEDVCWLLAYHHYHRNGDPEDAYAIFNALYSADALMPTASDYQNFLDDVEGEDDDEPPLIEDLLEVGQKMLAVARANPGREAIETWHNGERRQVICVDIVVEAGDWMEEGWLGLTLPEHEMLSDVQVFEMVQALLPEGVVPIYERRFRDRERRRGEIVYRWEAEGAYEAE